MVSLLQAVQRSSELWRLPLRASRRYWSTPLDVDFQVGWGGVVDILGSRFPRLLLEGTPAAWYNHTRRPDTASFVWTSHSVRPRARQYPPFH
jgi:hypothetical protein